MRVQESAGGHRQYNICIIPKNLIFMYVCQCKGIPKRLRGAPDTCHVTNCVTTAHCKPPVQHIIL